MLNQIFPTQGDFIWIEATTSATAPIMDAYAPPIGARVLNGVIGHESDKILVVDDNGIERKLSADKRIRVMHPTSIQGVEDFVQLGDLHEAAIIRNMHIRFKEKLIYTYCGSILVALNPYKTLPLYSAEHMRLYQNRRIGALPPHIFAIADNAYNNVMCGDEMNLDQCIIVSGDSGAGKTESTKFILQYLAFKVNSSEATTSKLSCIEQQIVNANPILEAFGNARTSCNNNSSRFGKFIDLQFNTQSGLIEAAKIEHYLLEKSRIVLQLSGERNYHIFYSMLKGLSPCEKLELELGSIASYHILCQNNFNDTYEEIPELNEIRSAMKVLMFKDAEISSIFKVLAALLHIGNLKYQVKMQENDETAELHDTANINRIIKLLQFETDAFMNAFCKRTISTRGEQVTINLNASQALDVRDAFIKGIYSKIFDYVVRRINNAIFRPCLSNKEAKTDCKESAKKVEKCRSIGILDIFGFEDLGSAHNSFEQFCINYASEQLQQFFIRHAFKHEQAEYEAQHIEWNRIDFNNFDNLPLLDILAIQPLSVLSLINDESIFPQVVLKTVPFSKYQQIFQATNQTLLEKLHVNHSQNEQYYIKPKSDLSKHFGINHYSGPVYYQVNGFVEKNRDHFGADLLSLINSSSFRFLHRLFDSEFQPMSETVCLSSLSDANCGGTVAPIRQTVALRFRRSLDSLMNRLESRNPFFIRCIKPNDIKKPMYFNREFVAKQLQCCGMLEAALICKAGFPVRLDYATFVNRYRVFLRGARPSYKIDYRQAARHICALSVGEDADCQFGKTKVFLKAEHEVFLQQELDKVLMHHATTLQKSIRGWIQRRNFEHLRNATIILQKNWRCYIQRIKYKRILLGIARLQAVFRSHELISHNKRLKSIITHLQAQCRGSILRNILRQACSRNDCRAAMRQRAEENDLINWPNLENELVDCFNCDVNDECPQKIPISHLETEKIDEDLSAFEFDKFAATYFENQATSTFSRKVLLHPLLQHDTIAENMAAVSIRLCILRFMDDFDFKGMENCGFIEEQGKIALVSKIHSSLSKKYCQKDCQILIQTIDDISKKKYDSIADNKKISINFEECNNDENSPRNNSFSFYKNFILTLNTKNNLELIHFITFHGILNLSLRDEIYCQLCKQLNTQNSSRISQERGWILLALCAGCFAPTSRLLKYLRCFLRLHCPKNANAYNKFVEARLERTISNGTRHQPPSHLEFESCKSKKHLELAVSFMNETTYLVTADSASNSAEICLQLCRKANLIPTDGEVDNESIFGFSLYITLHDKVLSLGAGADHIMDAISQSEQLVGYTGKMKKNWRLFFRKEIFSPWHNPALNAAITNLIYEQIIRGIRFGEYSCNKEEELALIFAQRYFIEHNDSPTVVDVNDLEDKLTNYLPENEIAQHSASLTFEKWLQLVLNVFRKKFLSKTVDRNSVKAEIVMFAMHKWPLLFSRFCEAFKFSGPPLPTNEVVIAVNWSGLCILDNQDQKLIEFSFPEIARVSCSLSKRIGADTVTFQIINGDEFTFQSPNSQDVCNLVEFFIKGLQKRSKYLLTMRTISATTILQQENEISILECEKGDLLILTTAFGDCTVKDGFVFAENTRSGLHGFIPINGFYIFPTLTKPSVDLVEIFNRYNVDNSPSNLMEQRSMNGDSAVEPSHYHMFASFLMHHPYTLEQFASENFYQPIKSGREISHENEIFANELSIENGSAADTNSTTTPRLTTTRSDCSSGSLVKVPMKMVAIPQHPQFQMHLFDHNDPWRWSSKPIKRPLLKRIGGIMETPSLEAVLSFKYIMKYMGDMPSLAPKYFLEFTDIIFRAPLKYQVLRDEIYCQLIKQLTGNPNPMSEERGWELLWLCLGLFAPSSALQEELNRFLRSRFLPISADCVMRLQRISKIGGVRKFPPHQVEVEAIQNKTTQIFHKIFLPSGLEEVIEVDSLTTARDFIARIVARLHLKNGVGFSIFIKIGEKVISMPDNEYLFDFIHQLADWMMQNRAHLKQTNFPQIFSYQIFFMRKLWINVKPGDDPNADLIFNYHQELPKYLRGYHNVTRQLAIKIAALILRAQTRDDKKPPFQQFQHIVQDIVPRDLIKSHSTSEWKKLINAEFEKLTVYTSADAKIAFLKCIAQFPTFGSAFFEVKQSSDPTMASRLIVAINRNGINLFNQDNKEHIVSYPFTVVNNWTSGNTYFHLTIGSLIKGNRLLFETTLGYKMDNLLTSYIQTLLSVIDKNQKQNIFQPKEMYEMEII